MTRQTLKLRGATLIPAFPTATPPGYANVGLSNIDLVPHPLSISGRILHIVSGRRKRRKMNIAIAVRSARNFQHHPLSLFSPSVKPQLLGWRTTGAVSFRNLATQSSREQESEDDSNNNNKTNMDKRKEEDDNQEVIKTGDVMAHSFGEGYATRSDEEGFGGIYGGNDSCKVMKEKDIDEDHPEYDKSQGSEVKEKEKARHQTTAAS